MNFKNPYLRIAAIYAGISIGVMQYTETVFPAVHLPTWSINMVIILTIIGFPITIFLAWAFEFKIVNEDSLNKNGQNIVIQHKIFNWQKVVFALSVSLIILLTTIYLYNVILREDVNNVKEITGLYDGHSIMKNFNSQKGQMRIDIIEVDPITRNVKAKIQWTDGLIGQGYLYGGLQSTRLKLKGTVYHIFYNCEIAIMEIEIRGEVTINDSTFKGDYSLVPLEGNTNGVPQEAEFSLRKIKLWTSLKTSFFITSPLPLLQKRRGR